MNVESIWSDDHVFFAAAVIQSAFGVNLTKVARVQPSIGCRNTLSTNQNLAVRRDRHVLTRDDLSKGTAFHMKGMIHCNDRTRLSQSISLDYDKPKPCPELLKIRIQTRTADDECPELPTEAGMRSKDCGLDCALQV